MCPKPKRRNEVHVIIFSFESQLFICVLPEVGRYVLKATWHTWRPRRQLVGALIFSLHHMGPGDSTQVLGFDIKGLYWLRHLTAMCIYKRTLVRISPDCRAGK